VPQKRTKAPQSKGETLTGSERTGVLAGTELLQRVMLPSEERLNRGPVVIVECVQNIPCNPCASACPRKAITIDGALTDTPKVDFEKCNGCTLCIAKCPGLAIFVINRNYSPTEASVTLPYELLPRPAKESTVDLFDRAGRKVGRGRVVRVLDSPAQDRCAVVTVAVPRKLWNEVRHFRPVPARRRE
jgi:Fe-S-cluster-containing hydrogenase component 2